MTAKQLMRSDLEMFLDLSTTQAKVPIVELEL